MTDLPPYGNDPLGPPAGPPGYPPPAPPPGPSGYPPPGPGAYAPPGPGAYPPPTPPSYPPYGGYQQQGYGWHEGSVAEYAGFWSRFAAAIVDNLIFSIPTNFVVASTESGSGISVLVQLLSFLGQVAYYTMLEGGVEGQTLGKKALGIRVVDADTGRPGIGYPRGLGRYFARILSAIPCFLGFFWMLWDPRKQTWHDKLARTIVVKV